MEKSDPDSTRPTQSVALDDYKDYYFMPATSVGEELVLPKAKRKGPRGGVTNPFPVRLHTMLEGTEAEGLDEEVVRWQAHGRSFIIINPERFAAEVLSRYFKQTQMDSFRRQLNLYGFRRLRREPDKGGYYHPLFLRGRADLCQFVLRSQEDRSPFMEPDLHSFPRCGRKTTLQSSSAPQVMIGKKQPPGVTEGTESADSSTAGDKEEYGLYAEQNWVRSSLVNSPVISTARALVGGLEGTSAGRLNLSIGNDHFRLRLPEPPTIQAESEKTVTQEFAATSSASYSERDLHAKASHEEGAQLKSDDAPLSFAASSMLEVQKNERNHLEHLFEPRPMTNEELEACRRTRSHHSS